MELFGKVEMVNCDRMTTQDFILKPCVNSFHINYRKAQS